MLILIKRKVQLQWIFNIVDAGGGGGSNINLYFICFWKAEECLLGKKLEIGAEFLKALFPLL